MRRPHRLGSSCDEATCRCRNNWEMSRIAVCKLTMQLLKSVRENNICNHRYSALNSPEPDPASCR